MPGQLGAAVAAAVAVTGVAGCTPAPPASAPGSPTPASSHSTVGPVAANILASPAPKKTIGGTPVVYLTFDDGPDTTGATSAVRRQLRALSVPATFFVLGQQLSTSAGRRLVTGLASDGHSVQVHGWDHTAWTSLSPTGRATQLTDTTQAVRSATGTSPTCSRPPYGSTNSAVRAAEKAAGLREQLWTVDPTDWRSPGAGAVTKSVAAKLRPGAVVLLHDGAGHGRQAAAALPGIVAAAKAKGLSFALLCTAAPQNTSRPGR